MFELETQLLQEKKLIELDKASPTFYKIKERLDNCGIAKNWCVEILHGGECVSLNDDTQLKNYKKVIVYGAFVLEKTILGP